MIQPEAGWDELLDVIKMIPALARTIAEEELDDMAEEFPEYLATHMELQTWRMAPLSPSYLAMKQRTGLDTRILLATHDYINAIKAMKPERQGETYQPGDNTSKPKTWNIGPPEGTHEPSGLPYAALAARLEFGVSSQNLPPRPHWQRAFKQLISPALFKPRMVRIGNKVDRQFRTYLKKKLRG